VDPSNAFPGTSGQPFGVLGFDRNLFVVFTTSGDGEVDEEWFFQATVRMVVMESPSEEEINAYRYETFFRSFHLCGSLTAALRELSHPSLD
jgi:hypothetical protein